MDKYIPKMVFALGVLLLGAAIYVFLDETKPTMVGTASAPPEVELSGTNEVRRDDRPWLKPLNEEPKPVRPRQGALTFGPPVSETHVRRVGLNMRFPDQMAFAETKARGMNVLVGTGKTGKPEFFLFSIKQKMKPTSTKAMLEEQFREEGLRAREVTSMNSKGGIGTLTVVKGTMRDADDFQAFQFSNSKSGYSHVLVMAEEALHKRPAKVRQVVDSISSIR